MTRKALVTGATGFTGSHLARRLVADGWRVVAPVRAASRTAELEAMGVKCLVADITRSDGMAELLESVDTVFHLAAAFRTEHADRQEFVQVNLEATRNLLRAAEQVGIRRFVHCSTVGVQGEIDDPPADETYRYAPGDHYQETKMAGELAALEAARNGMPVTVVRPVGIYGPGDRRFLKLFRPIARRRFVMVGSGRSLYHLTYVDDLVEGFLRVADNPAAVGEIFTVAGPRYTTLAELVSLIADAVDVPRPRLRIPYAPVFAAALICEKACRPLGISPPLYRRRVEFFSKDRAFDASKARRILDFEPRVDLEEGLARTATWYRSRQML